MSPSTSGLAPAEVHGPDRVAVAVEATRHEAGARELELAHQHHRAVRWRVHPGAERRAHAGAQPAVDLDDLAERAKASRGVDARGVAEVAAAHHVVRVARGGVGEAAREAHLADA